MNKRIVMIVIAVLAITIISFYAYLGGFSSPAYTVTTSEPVYVAGKAYKGTIKDEQMGNVFRRAAEVLDKQELDGVLGSIYYNNPDETSDSINAFIGVVVADTTIQLPADYELRMVPGGRQVLRGEINAHYMVAPGKLYDGIFEHAKEKNIQLQNFFLEWFPESHKAILEVPIKQ
ncbi:GyrI-like domain-containing protein [Pontibacter sp. SGAir0037]|uniref:GyrI-like domain-containing protein n=1 Tax=Pontibacter sp. SGAir0037 TaxID=2571030 RepID=UPI0010CD3AAF|nr:GyrI-like domain-containing protein [Pontibacter sp. SGAir0037]QCR24074.1 hypothetical protein C1N53_18075 [Pontibacter sp. SGAir0037]